MSSSSSETPKTSTDTGEERIKDIVNALDNNGEWLSSYIDPIINNYISRKTAETVQKINQEVDERYDRKIADKINEIKSSIFTSAQTMYDQYAIDTFQEGKGANGTGPVMGPVNTVIDTTLNKMRGNMLEYAEDMWDGDDWKRFSSSMTTLEFDLSYSDLTMMRGSDGYFAFPFRGTKKIKMDGSRKKEDPINCIISVTYPNKVGDEWEEGKEREVNFNLERVDDYERDIHVSILCMLHAQLDNFEQALGENANSFYFKRGQRVMFLPKKSKLFNRPTVEDSDMFSIIFPPASDQDFADDIYYRIIVTCS